MYSTADIKTRGTSLGNFLYLASYSFGMEITMVFWTCCLASRKKFQNEPHDPRHIAHGTPWSILVALELEGLWTFIAGGGLLNIYFRK